MNKLAEWRERLWLASRATLAEFTPKECGEMLQYLNMLDSLLKDHEKKTNVKKPVDLPKEYRPRKEGKR